MIRTFLLAAALLVAGCDSIPADPDGTLERVRGERLFKVGLIASHAPPPDRRRRPAPAPVAGHRRESRRSSAARPRRF